MMTLGSKELECESDEVTDDESGDDEKDEGEKLGKVHWRETRSTLEV